MKLTKSQLKQIIMKEMDEGLGDFVGNIKGKAMAGLKTLVDPFKDATDRELELDVMKNIIQKQVPEGTDLNDDEAEKLIDFLVAAFLKSPSMQKKYRGDKHYAMDLAVMALSDSSAGAPGPVAENKMKITKSQLKQIIKEELSKVLNETVLDAIPDVEKFSAEQMVPGLQKRPDLKDTKIYQLNRARYVHPDQAEKIDQALEMLGWTEEAMNHWSRNA